MRAMFVGLGSAGQRHLRNLRTLLGDTIDVIAHRATRATPVLDTSMNVVPAASLSELYGVREFDDFELALRKKPDLVFVANPNALHMAPALAAVRAGAHVFIEKPLSHSMEGVAELQSLAAAAGRVVAVGLQLRCHPGIVAVRKWIDDQRVGRIVRAWFINGEYLPGMHPYEDYRIGYAARADLGGGALVSQIHDFDLAAWLLGMPESVYAVGGQLSDLEVDVDDCVDTLMTVRLDGRPVPVSVGLDFVQSPPARRFGILGTRGRIEWDYHAGQAVLTLGDGTTETVRWDGFNRNDLFLTEMRAFLSAVKGEGKPIVDLQEGVLSLRLATAAGRSLQSGRVEIP